MSLLRLKDVRLVYSAEGRETAVLNQADVEIERGEMVAILGPSGSGKSTLLYILGCLLKPTSGSYAFAGHDVMTMDTERLAELRSKEIGFVFQQFHLLPRATVLQNVLLPTQYRRVRPESNAELRTRAEGLLANLGLSTHLKHRPNQLSGGQQQRVAIARALMNNPALILADEPTGNLDSKSAAQVLDTLSEIHRSGRTIIIITHDQKVAERCQRVITIHDGILHSDRPMTPKAEPLRVERRISRPIDIFSRDLQSIGQTAWQNLLRNKTRSFLTMIGVTIGIAALLSTVTLGDFTKKRILQGYESMGVNRVMLTAYPRWELSASDLKGVKYEGISQEHDIVPMRKLFPEMELVSPVVMDWGISSVGFGGRTLDRPRVLGVVPEYFEITNRKVVIGHPIGNYHVKNHSPVCVIGYEIAEHLFRAHSPLQENIELTGTNRSYSCTVIGVLAPQTSNDEGVKPNMQILVPESYLSLMANVWSSKPYELDVRVSNGSSLDDFSHKVQNFLEKKYGRSVNVRVNSNQVLVEQMKKFLNLFTILLAGVAFISLAVGGIGITNMMFVSVAERFKEIGLRKALGAQDNEILLQFLIESVILCGIAGIAGVVSAIAGYHLMLYLATRLFTQVQFEFVFNGPAILLSVICIFIVGLASGLVPALRAQKLEVVEALRSE